MMYFIMLPFNLLLLVLFLYTGKELTKHQDGRVLSVALPADKMVLPEVSAILDTFRRRLRLLVLAFLLLQIPPFFFRDYPISSSLYCLLWIFAFLTVFQILLNKSFDRLYALKLERGWGQGFVMANNSVSSADDTEHRQSAYSADDTERRQSAHSADDPAGAAPPYIMTVDLNLVQLKDKFRYPGWHWIPAFLLTAIGSIRWLPPTPEYTASYLLIGCSFLTYFTLLILYLSFGRTRTVFYSDDSDVNLALNYHRQHSFTKSTVLAAYGHGLCWLIGGLFPNACLKPSVMLCTFGASSILVISFLTYAFDSFRRQKRLLLQQHETDKATATPAMPDEDCFWRAGSYYNPNDPKLWVERRIGYGLTINEAHPAAKWFTAAMFLLVGGTFLMVLSFLPLDFPHLSVAATNTAITINAPGYDDEILLSGIEKAELLSERPTMHKNNGSIIKGYTFGTFYLPDYGQCHVWIQKERPPYLLLKCENKLYLIGSDRPKEMETLIQTLKAQDIDFGKIEKRAGK